MDRQQPDATEVGSSSLEPLETSDPPLRPQSRSQFRAHARWWKCRDRILDAMEASTNDEERKRYNRLQGCCASPEIRQATNGQPALRMNVCRDRCCPRCQFFRGLKAGGRVAALIVGFNAPRFFTLTLKHEAGEGLGAMLDRLMQAFRSLRKDPKWKARVKAGVWTTQATWSRTSGWHAHLHLVADGEFFPQKMLSECWMKATGGSPIVHITAVPDRQKVAQYIAGYISRTNDLETWSPEAIREFASAMHGRRTIHTFGAAHGVSVEEPAKDPEETQTMYVAHASVIVEQAQQGNNAAAFVITTLSALSSDWACAFGIDPRVQKPAPNMIAEVDKASALNCARDIMHAAHSPPPPADAGVVAGQREQQGWLM